MKIDSVNINVPAVKGQTESPANNSTGTNSRTTGNNASSLSAVNVNSALKERLRDKQQNKDNQSVSVGNGLLDLKAIFALDKEKNVVIKVLDKKGEVVRQYPPEEYINMIKKFKENVESLFSKEV
ncbi:MAG: flagellar protein FlaG [Thermodesulfovibrionales bacterium]|jgi:uncharacterized FlaG/YvyC family protein|nr:flagellar protein FlaG [Thermodesulfovibrionales bacterium]